MFNRSSCRLVYRTLNPAHRGVTPNLPEVLIRFSGCLDTLSEHVSFGVSGVHVTVQGGGGGQW